MKTITTTFTVCSTLATLLVGCVSDDPQEPTATDGGHLAKYAADPYGPAPAFRPSTCQEIKDVVTDAKDGEYTLYIQNQPTYRWKAYCADMQSAPTEYLSIAKGDGINTSMYASSGKQVTTAFEKVRIHPKTLAIDLGDTTFAASNGVAVHNGTTLTMMPYGIAMSCAGAPATANINLRGTPFRLEGALPQFGTGVSEKYDFAADRQNLNVTVTGDCGWVAQRAQVDPTSDATQFELRLAFFLPAPK
jgi:hypothetical protein